MSDMLCRFYMADRRKEDRMKRACVLIFLCLPLLLCGCAQKSAEREFFAMDTVMQLRAAVQCDGAAAKRCMCRPRALHRLCKRILLRHAIRAGRKAPRL